MIEDRGTDHPGRRSTPTRVGQFRSKPTTFGHDRMRSRLERDFARHLFLSEIAYQYEPHIFGPRGRRYLPDFLVEINGRRTYIEVKPTAAEVEGAKAKMAVIWDDEPDALLIVACAQGCVFHTAMLGTDWTSWIERWKHQ